SGPIRTITGSSPLQVLMAVGTERPAILSEPTVFCERAPSCSRMIVRVGRIERRSVSENTCPLAGRLDCAMRLVIGSGIEALSFRVEESLRHDFCFALAVEIVHREFLAEPRTAAAQERERD